MAVYRIRNTVSPRDLRYLGPEYLNHIKRHMIHQLAEKMFEVFGDLSVKTDQMTNEQYLEFTLGSWEDHEVAKVTQTARAEGWAHGAADERLKWQDHVRKLEEQVAQKETPDLADRG